MTCDLSRAADARPAHPTGVVSGRARASADPSTDDARAQAAFSSARLLAGSGGTDEAADALQKVIADYPRSLEAVKSCELLAVLHEQSGSPGDAIDAWTRLAQLAPSSGSGEKAVRSIGRLCIGTGSLADGIRRLKGLCGSYPSTPAARAAEAEIDRLIYAGGDSSALLQHWRSMVRPDDALASSVLAGRVACLYSTEKALDAGIGMLARLSISFPHSLFASHALVERARLQGIRGDPSGALSSCLRVIADQPNGSAGAVAVVMLKDIRMRHDSVGRALRELRGIAAAHPRSAVAARAELCIGEVLLQRGETGKAVRCFQTVLHRFPVAGTASDAKDRLARAYYTEALDARLRSDSRRELSMLTSARLYDVDRVRSSRASARIKCLSVLPAARSDAGKPR